MKPGCSPFSMKNLHRFPGNILRCCVSFRINVSMFSHFIWILCYVGTFILAFWVFHFGAKCFYLSVVFSFVILMVLSPASAFNMQGDRVVFCIFDVFAIGFRVYRPADRVFQFSINLSGSTLKKILERKRVASVSLPGQSHSDRVKGCHSVEQLSVKPLLGQSTAKTYLQQRESFK